MNREIVFIADFFLNDIIGGGEIHNEELISILRVDFGQTIKKAYSHNVSVDFLRKHKDHQFIVANFLGLSGTVRELLQEMNYIIYEHDHKYLKSRNPAAYPEFRAPPSEIINYEFYKAARAIFCQSGFHKKIVENNLNLPNIKNSSGNLWSSNILSLISSLSKKGKQNRASIMASPIEHKNTRDAIRYCEANKYMYDLIPQLVYGDFLRRMSNNHRFVFFPKTPETLSRIVVEARMMNVSVITNNLVGATKEPWYKFKGEELIEHVSEMRERIPKLVLEMLNQ